MPSLTERIKRSWNAFLGRLPTSSSSAGYSYRPDRVRLSTTTVRSILNSIYNRISVDCSQIEIRHVRLDPEQRKYKETLYTTLNRCLTEDANVDQTGRALIQDVVMSMFDEGCVAIVPTDTDGNPRMTDAYKILELRVGKIIQWQPDRVRLLVYNEMTGQKEEIVMLKREVAIIENPFYAIMNEPNSVLQRLNRTLNMIDRMNEKATSGKLDLIIQIPYMIKSPAKREMAEKRRKELESQMENSKLGIGYIDATEHIVQLNRSVENNLWTQASDLTNQLYNQLGLTEAIFNGTADEKAKLDYYNRTIEPIMSAIVVEMRRKWLSATARTQLQSIEFFRDPFRLVPVGDLAEIADKFTRNEIMTSNEFRSVIGMIPSKEKKADQLTNSNLYQKEEAPQPETSGTSSVSDDRVSAGKEVVKNILSKFQNG